MEKLRLHGKVALITGSSRGIGLATARQMAQLGATIVLNGRNESRLADARAHLMRHGFDAFAIAADVSQPDECRRMLEKIEQTFGRLDILINNAGISMRSNLGDLAPESCKKLVDVNLMGSIYPTLFAIPYLAACKGSLVFISSIAGMIGLPSASIYSATKFALVGLADALRCELAPDGIHVGLVYVGFTENSSEKTVIGADGVEIEPDRPSHMSQKEVAARVVELVIKRKRQDVLSAVGKLAKFASWLSPSLVEKTIVLSRRHKLSDHLGIR